MVCTSQSAAIPSIPSVQGRLKEHEKFWLDELEPSSFLAGIISEGYRLPFLRLPDPLCQLNHRSALVSASFVMHAINELVLGRCVVECSSCPIVCSPLWYTMLLGSSVWYLIWGMLTSFCPIASSSTRVWSLSPPCLTVEIFSQPLIWNRVTTMLIYMRIVGHIWASLGVVDPTGSGTCSVCYLLASPQHAMFSPSSYDH